MISTKLILPTDIRAFLLDLDGTLFNSMESLKSTYYSFLSGKGKKGSEEEFDSLTGSDIEEVVSILKAKYVLEEDTKVLFQEYLNSLNENYLQCEMMPGAEELLKFLYSKNLRIALVTSARMDLVNSILDRLGWQKYFHLVVTADLVKRTKPWPDLYQYALKQLAINPSAAVAVEDSKNGIRSAISASVTVIGVSDRENETTQLRDAGALFVAPNLVELKETLKLHFPNNVTNDLLPVNPGFKVFLGLSSTAVSDVLTDRIEIIWNEAKKQKKSLQDGLVLSFDRLKEGGLNCSLVQYRNFFAQLAQPELRDELQIKVVAISGICRSGKKLLIGKRSELNTQYPLWYELIPSGSLDPEQSHSDGTVDFESQVVEELLEEANIGRDSIRRMTPMGLFFDPEGGTVDICIEVELSESVSEQDITASGTSEYEQLYWLDQEEVENLVAANQLIVPTTLALLRSYFKKS